MRVVGLYDKSPYGLGIASLISEATQGILSGLPIVVIGGATSVGQLGTYIWDLSLSRVHGLFIDTMLSLL